MRLSTGGQGSGFRGRSRLGGGGGAAVGPPREADSAIDEQGGSGDVRVFGVTEEQDSVGHFFRRAQPAEGDLGSGGVKRLAAGKFQLAGRVGPAGLNAINANSVFGDF